MTTPVPAPPPLLDKFELKRNRPERLASPGGVVTAPTTREPSAGSCAEALLYLVLNSFYFSIVCVAYSYK